MERLRMRYGQRTGLFLSLRGGSVKDLPSLYIFRVDFLHIEGQKMNRQSGLNIRFIRRSLVAGSHVKVKYN
jgi:hypothetical protein